MAPPEGVDNEPAIAAWSRTDHAVVWASFPLVGAGAAWLVKALAGWIAELPWAPFQGPFELIARFAAALWATAVAPDPVTQNGSRTVQACHPALTHC
jgi:hypothetical protein